MFRREEAHQNFHRAGVSHQRLRFREDFAVEIKEQVVGDVVEVIVDQGAHHTAHCVELNLLAASVQLSPQDTLNDVFDLYL